MGSVKVQTYNDMIAMVESIMAVFTDKRMIIETYRTFLDVLFEEPEARKRYEIYCYMYAFGDVRTVMKSVSQDAERIESLGNKFLKSNSFIFLDVEFLT